MYPTRCFHFNYMYNVEQIKLIRYCDLVCRQYKGFQYNTVSALKLLWGHQDI
jgi:hypothetical protein